VAVTWMRGKKNWRERVSERKNMRQREVIKGKQIVQREIVREVKEK
jgi:hypothetical protein